MFFISVSYSIFCREALEAGEDLIAMNEKITELVEDGVPTLLAMEISRQVLDAEIPASKPFLLNEVNTDEENEDADQEEEPKEGDDT